VVVAGRQDLLPLVWERLSLGATSPTAVTGGAA
jgi:hypothetical protein